MIPRFTFYFVEILHKPIPKLSKFNYMAKPIFKIVLENKPKWKGVSHLTVTQGSIPGWVGCLACTEPPIQLS